MAARAEQAFDSVADLAQRAALERGILRRWRPPGHSPSQRQPPSGLLGSGRFRARAAAGGGGYRGTGARGTPLLGTPTEAQGIVADMLQWD